MNHNKKAYDYTIILLKRKASKLRRKLVKTEKHYRKFKSMDKQIHRLFGKSYIEHDYINKINDLNDEIALVSMALEALIDIWAKQ